jgi:hypothetical protein
MLNANDIPACLRVDLTFLRSACTTQPRMPRTTTPNRIDASQMYSREAAVFLLVHKMDLVAGRDKALLLKRRSRDLQAESGALPVTVFGTRIYDELLYKVCHPLTFCFARISHFRSPDRPRIPSTPRVRTDERRHGRES